MQTGGWPSAHWPGRRKQKAQCLVPKYGACGKCTQWVNSDMSSPGPAATLPWLFPRAHLKLWEAVMILHDPLGSGAGPSLGLILPEVQLQRVRVSQGEVVGAPRSCPHLQSALGQPGAALCPGLWESWRELVGGASTEPDLEDKIS